MKLHLVLVCSLMTLARGSLEPAGYRPPGTYPQTRYLSPTSTSIRRPDNRYVFSSHDSPRQDVDLYANELSSSLTLPRENEPIPFEQYLPANRQISDQHDYRSVIDEQRDNLPRYLSSNEFQHTFTQALLRSENFSPRESLDYPQDRGFPGYPVSTPDRHYLTSNEQSGSLSSRFYGQKDLSTSVRQTGSTPLHQHSQIEDTGSAEHSSSSAGKRHYGSDSAGYRYRSPENQKPAKYEFEYEVKDNYGNDYGHKETRNGEHTQGVYKVVLPDGRRQIVHYEADSHGYRPIITYEEAGMQSQTGQSTGYNY